MKLVLNRADSRVGVTPEDVQAITGRAADALVPSHRDVARSVNEGRPIVTEPAGLATAAPCSARACGLLFGRRPAQAAVAARLFGRRG